MSFLSQLFQDIRETVQHTAGGETSLHDPELNRFQRMLQRNLRVFFLVARLDSLKQIKLHAQALTADTLLALVPLLAVIFSIFNGLGGFANIRSQLEALIVDNLSGSPQLRDQLAGYLDQFVTNIHAGKLGALSIIILIWSVLSLLSHIEFAFNRIYGTPTNRPWLTRLLTYWGLLTFGPILLAASFALTAILQNSWVSEIVAEMGFISSTSVHLTPLFATWFALTIMYVAVPNTQVRLRSAALAALIAGLLWTIAKYGYALYVKHNIATQNIYGSLAIIPLFILWLYLSWLLVLFGAQLAFAFQNARTYRYEEPNRQDGQYALDFAACAVLTEVARNFLFNKGPSDPDRIGRTWGIPRKLLETVLVQLREGEFILDADFNKGLLPARNLDHIRLTSLLSYLRQGKGSQPLFAAHSSKTYLDTILEAFELPKDSTLADLNFRDIAEEIEKKESEAKNTAISET